MRLHNIFAVIARAARGTCLASTTPTPLVTHGVLASRRTP